MKNISFTRVIEENFVTEEDFSVLGSLFESRTNAKKTINMYTSFTFITPNYRAIMILYNISKILKLYPYMKLHIVLSDANMFNQEYIKSVGLQFETDYEKFIKKQIERINSYLLSFGAKPSQINIYTFSEIWEKVVSNKSSHFLINYYSVISKMNTDSSKNTTFDRFFQFSSDMFFSVVLQYLYPDLTEGIDLFFGRIEKKDIYSSVRSTLYAEGVSKIKKPYLIFFKHHPEISYNNRLPEWNMNFEEVLYIVSNVKPSKKDCVNLINLFKNDMPELDIILDGKHTKKTFEECLRIIESDSEPYRMEVCASVIYEFLQKRKCDIDYDLTMPVLSLNSKDEVIKITKLLKTKHILDILKLCENGETTSVLAKKLHLQVSNVSNYITQLKDLNLIKEKEGKFLRNHSKIMIDLDV